jgi:hypothetical protein
MLVRFSEALNRFTGFRKEKGQPMRSRPRVRLGTREADEALSSWHMNVYEEPDDDQDERERFYEDIGSAAVGEEQDDDR